MKDAFSKLGRIITEKEIDEIMANHDTSHDGSLSFEEFRSMMLQEVVS
jgi:Ca2+-binding EF-hand superfamily protein